MFLSGRGEERRGEGKWDGVGGGGGCRGEGRRRDLVKRWGEARGKLGEVGEERGLEWLVKGRHPNAYDDGGIG